MARGMKASSTKHQDPEKYQIPSFKKAHGAWYLELLCPAFFGKGALAEVLCRLQPGRILRRTHHVVFRDSWDLHMSGPKPENGAEGLRKYDPDAFALLDDFYSGRMKIPL